MKKVLSIILAVMMMFNVGVLAAFAADTDILTSISSVSASPGDKIEVFIGVQGVGGIKTLTFYDFDYDNTVLSVVEDECVWLISGKLKDIDFENNASIITFADNTTYNGNILKLVFVVSDDAEARNYPISCQAKATRIINGVETGINITNANGAICIEKQQTDDRCDCYNCVKDSLSIIRGTASVKSYKGDEYIAITMAEGRTMTGLYKDMVDGGTVEFVDINGTIQDRANDYVAYQTQNKTNPVATMKVTYANGATATYSVVFELYEIEREIDFDPAKKIKPIRGKISIATDEKGEYILDEMVEGQSSVGVYKTSLDGTTATLDGAEGMFTEQEKLYIFYGSQNTTNPEGRLTVTETDGSQKTYRIVFKMYEMDPYVNAAKGLRPVRGAVTFDADGTIRIKMTSGQTSVGLYKTMANGATFKIVDANGKVTNNPSSLMFYMTNNVANITAKILFTLPDGTTKQQKIIFDMGLEDNPDPLVYLTAVRGTVGYQNDGEEYIEVKANVLSTGVGLSKNCLVKYTITDVDGVMTENDSRYYIYKSQNPDGVTAKINFLQSDGSYKSYKVKFVF